MELREIGAMLREERERQGLSLDVVSDKIKITRTCLAAIEDGNEKALPHPVYAKGFIKNYARLLGVDHEDFTRELSEAYKVAETPLHEMTVLQDIPDDDCGCASGGGLRFPVRIIAAVMGVLLLAAGIGWFVYARVFDKTPQDVAPAQPATTSERAVLEEAPDAGTAATTAPVVPSVPPETSAPAAPTGANTTASKPAQPAAVSAPDPAKPAPTSEDRATQDIATSGPAATSAPAVPAGQNPPPSSLAAPGGRTFTVGETGAHVVSIVATDRCWLQAGADGGAMHETMLEKGDAFLGRFAEYMLVRLGNAGAVEIRFDNKLYPLQPGKSAVKTLKFVAKKDEDSASKASEPATQQPAAGQAVAIAPSQAENATPPAGESGQGPKEVEIFGQDGSWIIVTPDKGPAKEVYIKKGQRITMPFGEKIEIKLGNPSSVVFRYDGKEIPVTTEKGASRSVRFP